MESSNYLQRIASLKEHFTLFTAQAEITGITLELLLLWFGNQTPVGVSVCHQSCFSVGQGPGIIAVCTFNHVTVAYVLPAHKQDACWRLSGCKQTHVEAQSIVGLLSFPGISISNRQLPGWARCFCPDISEWMGLELGSDKLNPGPFVRDVTLTCN